MEMTSVERLQKVAERWGTWIGPRGDEERYKDMAATLNEALSALQELAAAKETWEKQARKAAGEDGVQYVGPNTIFAVSDKLRAERDALRAHVERMRAAAELGECYMKVFRHEIARNNATFEGSEDQAEVDGDLANIKAALAATPAQSLASVKAAALREVAKKWYREGNPSQENAAEFLEDEADRIEKEGA